MCSPTREEHRGMGLVWRFGLRKTTLPSFEGRWPVGTEQSGSRELLCTAPRGTRLNGRASCCLEWCQATPGSHFEQLRVVPLGMNRHHFQQCSAATSRCYGLPPLSPLFLKEGKEAVYSPVDAGNNCGDTKRS